MKSGRIPGLAALAAGGGAILGAGMLGAVILGAGISAAQEKDGPAPGQEPETALSRAAEPEEATIRRVVFLCPRDKLLTVEFLNAEPGKPAVVHPPDGPAITLALQPSGSGFRYADATRELRGKGRDVTWTDAGTPPVVCTERIAPPGGTEPN
ncbi:MliC family protein [Methylobacterium planeticum]|nr:MliC family protein [Methylobacterium planeticum]